MILINLTGLLLVALIVWWFWLYQPTEIADAAQVILVENGTYQPSQIKLAAGQPTTLHFLRRDASPCAETVQFPALEISETLPLNQTRAVRLPALGAGDYVFHCQMQMYRGTLRVE